MAMYEDKGYCPNNSFIREAQTTGEGWKEIREVLGDRTGYMVYLENSNNYAGCYVVPMLFNGDELARKVAYKLDSFIPNCEYAKEGKMIACFDVVNPYQIPMPIAVNSNGQWVLCDGVSKADHFVASNDNYLVAMENLPEMVKMFIYKR